ncbi:hypothetical protein [uncultured Paraglaciecola sp.]|uniref:hypothetical protein n=1 Tax=uncultured Paraglaciecola sp. TaxID=1765024 RepID=UPI0026034C0D|nr:hypothetical protein [uncultured Paraglaciecola sp.]
MLALQNVSSIISSQSELYTEPKKFNAHFAPTSYSGFVPNEVFNLCSPIEITVFAVIQYLSFFSIKCSNRNIGKNMSSSASGIKNALNSLSKRGLTHRKPDGTYSFRTSSIDHPSAFCEAKELCRQSLGYWFPIDTLKSNKITNQEKKAFSLLKNLTSQQPRKMDMEFIALKLGISRVSVSKIINSLLSKKLISRFRPHHRSAYTYQTGGQEMSIYKKDLSTENRKLIEQGTQNDTPKGTQNFTSLSINKSKRSFIDIGKEERSSDTYKSGQKKSLFFFKELIELLIVEIQEMDRNKNQEQDSQSLDEQYTQACIGGDLDKIQELRFKMATNEIRGNKTEQIKNSSERTKSILTDYEYLMKKDAYIKIPDELIKKIGSSVKSKVDLSKHEDSKSRKMAFCLTFNSFFLDLKAQLARSDMRTSVEICLKRLSRDSYDINYEIISRSVQNSCNEHVSASNQLYESNKNWMD